MKNYNSQFNCIEKTLVELNNIEMLRIFSKPSSSKESFNSFNFIKSLKQLKKFETDYIIKDGDLTPLMNLNDACILTWKKL